MDSVPGKKCFLWKFCSWEKKIKDEIKMKKEKKIGELMFFGKIQLPEDVSKMKR